jgi:MFS family permease
MSWLFIYYSRTSEYLIISRILGGIGGGGSFAVIPNYISEISDDDLRGFLGSFLVLQCNCGLLLAYICGEFLDYYTVPLIMIPVTVIFLILFSKVPDSPRSLANRQRFDASSKFYYKEIFKILNFNRKQKNQFYTLKASKAFHTYQRSLLKRRWNA